MGGCKGQQGRSKGLKVGATCNLLRALPSWRLWQPPWAMWSLGTVHLVWFGFLTHGTLCPQQDSRTCYVILLHWDVDRSRTRLSILEKSVAGKADSKLSNSTPLKGYTIGRAHPKGPTLHVHLSRHSRIFNTEHGQLQQAFWSFERKLINQDYQVTINTLNTMIHHRIMYIYNIYIYAV